MEGSINWGALQDRADANVWLLSMYCGKRAGACGPDLINAMSRQLGPVMLPLYNEESGFGSFFKPVLKWFGLAGRSPGVRSLEANRFLFERLCSYRGPRRGRECAHRPDQRLEREVMVA